MEVVISRSPGAGTAAPLELLWVLMGVYVGVPEVRVRAAASRGLCVPTLRKLREGWGTRFIGGIRVGHPPLSRSFTKPP